MGGSKFEAICSNYAFSIHDYAGSRMRSATHH